MNNVIYENQSDEINYIYFNRNEYANSEAANNVKPHFHDAIEFKYVISGKYSLMIGGVEKTLTAGEMIFVKPKEIHYNTLTKNTEYYTLVFNSKFIYDVCGKNKTFGGILERNEKVNALLSAMFSYAYEKWLDYSEENRRGFMYRFIGTLAEFYPTIEIKTSESEYDAGKILQYIQENYAEDLTLQQVSKKFGYAPNYFSTLFKKHVGMNFRNYINRFRIDVACRMINENESIPLWLIAEKVGYKSFVTFYRAYKKYANGKSTLEPKDVNN